MDDTNFFRAYKIVIDQEGGFSNDPNDPGNWTGGNKGVGELKGTMLGISAAQYPSLDIPNLKPADVADIYKKDYWDKNQCSSIPWPFALMLFDCGVNQGVGVAAKLLQMSLGTSSDGIVGNQTIIKAQEGTYRNVAMFSSLRAHRYMRTKNFDIYGNGWLIRLALITMETART